MEQLHRKAIYSIFVDLSKSLDVNMMMASLIQDDIYDGMALNNFQAHVGRLSQNQALLMDIETRGPNAYNAFLRALRVSGQDHLANQLELYCLNKTETVSWPDPNGPVLFEGSVMTPAQETPDAGSHNNDYIYHMGSKPRGQALIINNQKFHNLPERRGTEIDGRNLASVFKKLDFNVDLKCNLKGGDMVKTIKKFTTSNHTKYDCAILTILTHGIEGAVYGVDGKTINVDDILKLFYGDRAPTLIGKPKLIILQACRGERFGKGADAPDGAGECHVEMSLGSLISDSLNIGFDFTDACTSSQDKVPIMSDILIAYATVPGYVSWRNSERGSWFIQALTAIMLSNAHKEDMLSMLTMVNSMVAKAFQSTSGQYKQMPSPVTTLTKKLFFYPGYGR